MAEAEDAGREKATLVDEELLRARTIPVATPVITAVFPIQVI